MFLDNLITLEDAILQIKSSFKEQPMLSFTAWDFFLTYRRNSSMSCRRFDETLTLTP